MRKRRELTVSEAADALGLSHQAIGQWVSKPGAPMKRSKAGKSLLLWPEFPRWREQELLRSASGADDTLKEAARRERVAKAALAEMKLDQQRGLLCTREQYRDELSLISSRLFAVVRSLPSRFHFDVMGLTTDAEADRVLRKMTDAMLRELSSVADDVDEESAA